MNVKPLLDFPLVWVEVEVALLLANALINVVSYGAWFCVGVTWICVVIFSIIFANTMAILFMAKGTVSTLIIS